MKRFKFADEKNNLVDEDGNRVDREGNRVDEEGYILNEEGKRVNINDLPVLEDGDDVEGADFEDDLGVVKDGDKKAPTRKRKTKKEDTIE